MRLFWSNKSLFLRLICQRKNKKLNDLKNQILNCTFMKKNGVRHFLTHPILIVWYNEFPLLIFGYPNFFTLIR